MACEDCVLTGPCLEHRYDDSGNLILDVQVDGTTIQCTDEGLQAIGGGFSAVAPISWSGEVPTCTCANAVRLVNGGTEMFAPELYAFQFSGRSGRFTLPPSTPAGTTFANAIGVQLPFQPGDPSQFHPTVGWDALRHEFQFGTVGAPILNPFCRPMHLWFLIRTRAHVQTGIGGTLIHQSSISLNGGGENPFVNLTQPFSPTTRIVNDSTVMRTPTGIVGLEIPPGGSFYASIFNWVDQDQGQFSPDNAWFDSEIQVDALGLAYAGQPPNGACPPVVI